MRDMSETPTIPLNDKDTVYVNEVHNYANNKLPWYQHPENIPSEDMAEAQSVARELSDPSETDYEYEWRMRHYTQLRIGWSWGVRCYYPWFMYSHAEAMAFMRKMCLHKWGEKVSHTRDENKILGTYDKGYEHTCEKCGETEYVRTSYNNWSGD